MINGYKIIKISVYYINLILKLYCCYLFFLESKLVVKYKLCLSFQPTSVQKKKKKLKSMVIPFSIESPI